MQKTVKKFATFEEAEEAEYTEYRLMDGNAKLQVLVELIMPENPDEAVIERSARVYPLAQRKEG